MAAVLMVGIPAAASAQTRYCNDNNRRSRNTRTYYNENARYNDRYDNDRYDNDGYVYDNGYKKPNVYDRHRKAINIAVATGAGAVLGALLGGKKGALIGAAAGVAGGAIVTAKQKPRNYYRY